MALALPLGELSAKLTERATNPDLSFRLQIERRIRAALCKRNMQTTICTHNILYTLYNIYKGTEKLFKKAKKMLDNKESLCYTSQVRFMKRIAIGMR